MLLIELAAIHFGPPAVRHVHGPRDRDFHELWPWQQREKDEVQKKFVSAMGADLDALLDGVVGGVGLGLGEAGVRGMSRTARITFASE